MGFSFLLFVQVNSLSWSLAFIPKDQTNQSAIVFVDVYEKLPLGILNIDIPVWAVFVCQGEATVSNANFDDWHFLLQGLSLTRSMLAGLAF